MSDAVRGPKGKRSGSEDSRRTDPNAERTGAISARTKREGPGSNRRETPADRDPVPPVCEGQVVADKYLVEQFIGQGGMGVVVAATHLQLEQRVALKFLYRGGEGNEEVVERFIREARAAAKIQSEHVGRVIDVGSLPSGEPYMVMEHLEGRDLSAVLITDGALPVARAVEHVLQACEAIAEAHAFGIVHRDLKPANLFLARRIDGSQLIKVLDFGISKLLSPHGSVEQTDAALTNPSAVMGSPLYMSPEQMHASMGVDARTDIWALGVILYELVTTRTPFEAESIPLIHAAVLHDEPAPLRLADAPEGFEAAIFRCLEKDSAKRYADIAELVTALAPFSPRQGRITTKKVARLFAATRGSDRPPPSLKSIPAAPGSRARAPAPGSRPGAIADAPGSRIPEDDDSTTGADVTDTNGPTSTITAWGEGQPRPEAPISARPAAAPSRPARAPYFVAALALVGGAAIALVVTRRFFPHGAPAASAPGPSAVATAETSTAPPSDSAAGVASATPPAISVPSAAAVESAPAASAVPNAPLLAKFPRPAPSRAGHPSARPGATATAAAKSGPTTASPSPAPPPTGTTGFGDRE